MTLFTAEKLMNFRKDSRYVTFKVPHGVSVLLSGKRGGYIDQSIQHKVTKAGKTRDMVVWLGKIVPVSYRYVDNPSLQLCALVNY